MRHYFVLHLTACRFSLFYHSCSPVNMVTEKSFAAGSPFPALEPGKLRLYSMRFCPYAQRTRLVLAAKQIPYETVNVDLRKKPDWFLARNPLGMVPVLEQDNKIVYESAITCDYLEEIYPEPHLSPTDPYLRAQDRMLSETFSTVTTLFYKILRGKGENKEDIASMQKALGPYESALKKRGNFFGGAAPGMVDYMMWPWFERFPVLTTIMPELELTESNFPALAAWQGHMNECEAVKATAFDLPTHLAFMKSYSEGKPNYDIGL